MAVSRPDPEIIIVDDEPHLVDGLRRGLTRVHREWRIEGFTSPEEALVHVAAHTPAVVVTDLNMPGRDGFSLIAHARRHAPHARFILLTGVGDFEVALEAINAAGVFRFLTKPCEAENVAEAIRDALVEHDVMSGAQSAFGQGFEQAPVATVSVAVESMRVITANTAARALFDQRDGLLVDEEQVLRASRPEETRRLHAVIRALSRDVPEFLALERPSQAGMLAIAATPLEGTGGREVALRIADPTQAPHVSVDSLVAVYGFTLAEAAIAAGIARGLDLNAAADEAGVTVSTARTYLKRAFSKAGVSRQAELAARVAALPAFRRAQA